MVASFRRALQADRVVMILRGRWIDRDHELRAAVLAIGEARDTLLQRRQLLAHGT